MAMQLKSKQRGITFIGLVFVASVLGIAGVIAAQVFPTALEYQTIGKAAQKAADGGGTVAQVRSSFDKQAAVDNIYSVDGSQLEVTKEGDKVVVSYAYPREIHLVGPAYLVLKYKGRAASK
jgi:hypothetical protein